MDNVLKVIIGVAGLCFIKQAYDKEMENPESRKARDTAVSKVKEFFSSKKDSKKSEDAKEVKADGLEAQKA